MESTPDVLLELNASFGSEQFIDSLNDFNS